MAKTASRRIPVKAAWVFSAALLNTFATSMGRRTYIQMDHGYSSHGEYDVCHGTAFAISTCQSLSPHTSLCTGEGGYEEKVTTPLVLSDQEMTMCCNPDDDRGYNNVTSFAANIQGKQLHSFVTLGCDFSEAEGSFLSLSGFENIVVKSQTGTRELEIDLTEEGRTQKWISELAGGASGESDFHIQWELFKFRNEATRIAKSFSFASNDGTADITTVAYYGT